MKHMILSFKMKGDVVSDHFLMLCFQKDSLTMELLAGERQSLWSALRCSITHRFDYWLQMSYPTGHRNWWFFSRWKHKRQEVSEAAAAAALCLPSPACADMLGQVIRGAQVVDLHGEAVQCTITTGDHQRERHDSFKMRFFQMCQWAGVDADVEVFIEHCSIYSCKTFAWEIRSDWTWSSCRRPEKKYCSST